MYQDIAQGTRESHEGYLQVACKNCFMAQEIPEPPKRENLTVWKCAFCEEVQTLHHNLADWKKYQFISNCLLYLVIVLCVAFVLGAVGWVTWLYL